MQAPLNPFNKLDLERLIEEASIESSDYIVFHDVSESGKKERKIKVTDFLAAVMPQNLRLSEIPTAVVEETDKLVFVDDSAIEPKERAVTVSDLFAAAMPENLHLEELVEAPIEGVDYLPFLDVSDPTPRERKVTVIALIEKSREITTEQYTGFGDYNNSAVGINLLADTWTDVPNDTVGSLTNTAYLPGTVASLMDPATGYLDFTDLTLGSELRMRNEFVVNPGANNSLLEVRYVLGQGAGEYTLPFLAERLDLGQNIDYRKVTSLPIYIGDENTLGGVGKLQVKLSSVGVLTNTGSYISANVR